MSEEYTSGELFIYHNDRLIEHTWAFIPDINSEIYVNDFISAFKVVGISAHRGHYEIDVQFVKEPTS